MARVFNPPPGWPKPEEGWTPPPGWKPDPSWPEPPKGWDYWTEKADDVGSSLFGSSSLGGSSLFENTESATSSYGSVSPSGEASIPGAPDGPDFTAHARDGAGGSPSAPSSGGYEAAATGQGGPTQGPGGTTLGTGQGAATAATTGTPDPGTGPPRSATRPGGGWGGVIAGLVLAVGGVVATVVGYVNAGPGEEYSVWFGPIIVGILLAVVSFFRTIRSRAEARKAGPTGYTPGPVTQPGSTDDATGGYQTGQASTVSTQNPTDPKNYRP